MPQLLTGAPAAAALAEKVRESADMLRAQGVVPCLAILRVGGRSDALAYERAAQRRCTALGLDVRCVTLPDHVSQEALLAAVQRLNEDETVHGILPLLPLPAGLDAAALCCVLAPQKDVDGVTPASRAALYALDPCFAPCTAEACMALLRAWNIPVAGKRAVVVGRSLVAGRPLAMLLLSADATVTICHSRTQNLAALCREADILIAAAGCRALLTAQHVRTGQVVLDVGIHTGEDGALCGDVDFAAAAPIVSALTPVPGGIGSVTNTVLAAHTIRAAEKISKKSAKRLDTIQPLW